MDDQKAPPNSTVLFELVEARYRTTTRSESPKNFRNLAIESLKLKSSMLLAYLLLCPKYPKSSKVVNPVIFENNPQYYPNGS